MTDPHSQQNTPPPQPPDAPADAPALSDADMGMLRLEELRRWRASNESLIEATQRLAERLEVVASRQEIDAAMDQRMATVEREAAEALSLNAATARRSRTRAWVLIVMALIFSILLSMQLRDIVAYQCYPPLGAERGPNVALCDAVFPFSPHDFGGQVGASFARVGGGIAYALLAAALVAVGLLYRRRYTEDEHGSNALLSAATRRAAEAERAKREAAEKARLEELRRTQQRRRATDPPPVDPGTGC